jgi:hypothetical protein
MISNEVGGKMVRTMRVLSMAVSFLLLSSVVMAEDTAKGDLRLPSQPHVLEAGFMFYHFDYKEDLNPPNRSTEKGWVPGVYVSYAFNKPEHIHSKLLFEFSSGDVDYDGTTQSGTPISFQDSSQTFYRFEWDLGYTFSFWKGYSITPYVGYGYRYWKRWEPRITPDYWTYEEKYTWHYIPVGVKANVELNDTWNIGANVAARFMCGGEMTAYRSEVYANYSDPTFSLGDKTGFFAEMPVRYRLTKEWSVVGSPWYEYSEIGESDVENLTNAGVATTGYEPFSRTRQYGINVGLIYSF